MRAAAAALVLVLPPAHAQDIPHPSLQGLEPAIVAVIRDARAAASRPGSDADRALALARLGMVYQANHFDSAAHASYRAALALAPGQHPRWQYLAALTALDTGDIASARAGLERVAGAYLPARVRLGLLQLGAGELAAAADSFRRVLAREPGHLAALTGLGRIALADGQDQQAIDYLSRVVQSAPQAGRVHYNLAQAYRRLKRLDLARQHLARRNDKDAPWADPWRAEVQQLASSSQQYLDRGAAAAGNRDWPAAASAYREALRRDPDSVPARVGLARAEELQGRTGPALELYRAVVAGEDVPETGRVTALWRLGILAESAGDETAAREYYQRVLHLDAAEPRARYRLGMLLMRAARWPEAAAHLEQLVALQPGRQLPRYRLAIARLAAGDCAAAAATIRQAWEMNRNEGSVLLALVRILAVCPARPADSELALAEARRLAAAVQSAAVREALAMALAANGEFVQAQEIQAALVAAGNENRQRPERVDNLSRYRAGQPARRAWPAGAEVFHPGLASATDQ